MIQRYAMYLKSHQKTVSGVPQGFSAICLVFLGLEKHRCHCRTSLGTGSKGTPWRRLLIAPMRSARWPSASSTGTSFHSRPLSISWSGVTEAGRCPRCMASFRGSILCGLRFLPEGRFDHPRGHVPGDLRGFRHAPDMGGGDRPFLEQGQLFGQMPWLRRAQLGTQPFEIGHDAVLVFSGGAVRGMGMVAEFPGGVDESAAVEPHAFERAPAEPHAQRVEHRQQPPARVGRGLFHLAHQPVAKLLVTSMQHGENQFVLGPEMFVERHLCDAGFGQDLVDPGGVEAARVKKFQGGIHQIVAAGFRHIYKPYQTVLYTSCRSITGIQGPASQVAQQKVSRTIDIRTDRSVYICSLTYPKRDPS